MFYLYQCDFLKPQTGAMPEFYKKGAGSSRWSLGGTNWLTYLYIMYIPENHEPLPHDFNPGDDSNDCL